MAEVAHAPQPTTGGRKLLLRLDDGSLIGDKAVLLNNPEGGAVLLEPSNAARVARAGQPELERLDRLLEVFRNKYPTAYSIPKSQVRNHNPYREEGQRALKRQRSLLNGDVGSPLGPGGGYPGSGGGAAAAYPGSSGGGGGGGDDWERKCHGVLQAVYSEMGPKELCYHLPAKDVFYKTVAETFPGIATNYYQAIRSPITFRDIEGRLAGHQYDGPQSFADDVRLLFDNAVTFTQLQTDPVHRLAVRLRARFDEAWAATGYCADARGRRSNAGVARERFEHAAYEQPAPQQRRSASKQRQDDFYRAASHEVSSYQEASAPELPHDVMADVADSIGELPEEQMGVAVSLLNDECKVTNEDGEMELDFEFITYDALMRVDSYIRECKGLPPRPPPAAAQPPPPPHAGAVGPAAAAGARPAARRRGVQFDDSDDDDVDYDDDSSED